MFFRNMGNTPPQTHIIHCYERPTEEKMPILLFAPTPSHEHKSHIKEHDYIFTVFYHAKKIIPVFRVHNCFPSYFSYKKLALALKKPFLPCLRGCRSCGRGELRSA